mmetsp:Transcript_21597/g.47266  ORF Transcript_21597/g.47266 Transcript_21597/m.47266 type:complete len:134 (+) Transcript_21597:210-611(+)|eukprot:CAMPEP_0202907878 /NCGR_PEP_ID=MMETSP1392-20130828/44129_1 /ASSEMBLY_ACC=CAM_ASM_000868 /TAXON_ID=225041 /ORGANISM="Chlamydomonas chlamydogama, Strain SAG 11-48b" /LENGTH=133 /DNA_ID=CAMNT_0049596951 /DNA_START=166 /DNA_END=567 /DNA_ORIENTATION=+
MPKTPSSTSGPPPSRRGEHSPVADSSTQVSPDAGPDPAGEVKLFVLDLSKVYNMLDFHLAVRSALCPQFPGYGKNLDAFVDILRGGFGSFEYKEHIRLHVRGVRSASQFLRRDWKVILEILQEADNVELTLLD